MAFGNSLKEKPAKREYAEGEAPQTFEWQWVPLNGGNRRDKEVKGGSRKIRMLPEVANGKIVTDEFGKEVTAGEYRFLEVWMDVMKDGQMKPARIMLDWRKPFNNPYWNLVAQPTEKGSPQRKAQRQKFALNVVDLTPVLQDENGRYVYADENGVYRLSAQGQFVDTPTGTPTPLRKVRILEQSAGDAGGKHFLQQLFDAVSGLEDGDGEPRQPHEVDLLIKITGIDVETRRSLRPTANFNRLPDDLLFAPRYDLETWTQPWPDEAVIALINGADFNEVVEQFNIQLFPELLAAESGPVAEAVTTETQPLKPIKGAKGTKKLVEDSALFDD